MNVLKIALLGTAALVAASVGARAENLDALKSAMNDLTIGAVADAPAAAAPGAVVTWNGRVRLGVGYVSSPNGGIGAVAAVAGPNPAAAPALWGQTSAADIRAVGRISVAGVTQTAVGEVGVNVALQGAAGSNTAGIANGSNSFVRTDGVSAYWKMSPALTMTIGQLGCLCTGYSWDAIANNYFYASTQTSILGFKSSGDDPVGIRFGYADGPLGFAMQVYDGSNVANTSYFGAMAKASYKMDAFGIDFGGSYNGLAAGPAWSVYGGLGYSAGAFGFGASLATGNSNGTATGGVTPGSVYARLALSDQASLQMGVTREFQAAGNTTTFGAGMYYSPVKQLTFGIEGSYLSDTRAVVAPGVAGTPGVVGASNDGAISIGLVSAFSF